jgi:sRNA-binding protein
VKPQAVIELLAERFPAAFAVYERRRRPLRLGVHLDVLAALNGAITPGELSAAMRLYCGNTGYLKACVSGAPRIGLNDEVAGQVTPEEAASAKQRLEHQRAKQTRRKQMADHAPPKTRKINLRLPVPPPIPGPRAGLADLKAAAAARRAI